MEDGTPEIFPNRRIPRLIVGLLVVVLTAALHLALGPTAGLVCALAALGVACLVELTSPLGPVLRVDAAGLRIADTAIDHPEGRDEPWTLPWSDIVSVRAAPLDAERVLRIDARSGDAGEPRTRVTLGRSVPADEPGDVDVLDPAAAVEILRACAPDHVRFEAPDDEPHEREPGDVLADLPTGAWRRTFTRTLPLAVLTFLSFALLTDLAAALALVAVLAVHEGGHLLAVLACGMPVRGLYFVPFLGAFVAYEESGARGRAWSTRAFVALAGPLLGGLAAVAALAAHEMHHETHRGLLWWFAWMGIALNLINLVPARPLDGSHVLQAMARSCGAGARGTLLATASHGVMLVAAATLIVILDSLLFRLLMLAGALGAAGALFDELAERRTERWLARREVPAARIERLRAWFRGASAAQAPSRPMAPWQTALCALTYFGLVGLLAAPLL